MTTYTVKSAGELSGALSKVKAGDVVQLSGNVGTVNLTAKHNGVTIQGSGTVSSMTITKASNVTVSGVTFKGSGTGLKVQDSSGVSIANCNFSGFNYGASFSETSSLNVTGNNFSGLKEDAMRFAAITNGTISGNVYNEGGSKAGYSHKDFIQFWTHKGNGEGPSSNIKITNNKFYGSDSYTHGIFINNEANGPHHKGFTITGNYINSGHTHGITLIGVDSSTISQNTLVKSGSGKYFPLINVTSNSQNITITNNTAPSVPGAANGTWNVSGNHETGGSGIKHYDTGGGKKGGGKKAAKAGIEVNKEKAVAKSAADDSDSFRFTDKTKAAKAAPVKVADADHSAAAATHAEKAIAVKHAPAVDADLVADAHLASHKVAVHDAHDFLL
jgi:hypothetical protein